MSGAWIYAALGGTTLLGVTVVNLSLLLLLKWRDADTFRSKAEAWHDRYQHEAAHVVEAEARAEAAEKALAEIRMKRSLAVSKGNRRRAELERARILQTTEAVRVATARKKQPQGSLPL